MACDRVEENNKSNFQALRDILSVAIVGQLLHGSQKAEPREKSRKAKGLNKGNPSPEVGAYGNDLAQCADELEDFVQVRIISIGLFLPSANRA